MASTKTSINVTDIPCFNGHAYQQWVDHMTGIFLITNTKDVIEVVLPWFDSRRLTGGTESPGVDQAVKASSSASVDFGVV